MTLMTPAPPKRRTPRQNRVLMIAWWTRLWMLLAVEVAFMLIPWTPFSVLCLLVALIAVGAGTQRLV